MTDDQILTGILSQEGGYVDHALDRGGPTNHGITLATLSRWRGQDLTAQDVKELTEYEAREIYRVLYLAPFDGIDPELKPQLVDIAVNSGVGKARQLLAKAQQQTSRPVKTQLVIERLENYAQIVRANPSQAAFIVGWTRRAVSFLLLVLIAGCALKTDLILGYYDAREIPASFRPRDRKLQDCDKHKLVVLEDQTELAVYRCSESDFVFVDLGSGRTVARGEWMDTRFLPR